jgi:group II intron reverse transcriptase/maturase
MIGSRQTQRKQKTSNEDYLSEIRLETEISQIVPSVAVASFIGKAKYRDDTENLLERIVHRDNMNEALKRVIKNKGSHGIDGMQVDELRPYLMEHGRDLVEMIIKGSYKPNPVKRVMIPKPDGSKRALGIPTVVDRVVQQAIHQELSKVFEPKFSNNSFGFRPGKSAHMALQQAKTYINEGYKIVCDIDLERFFDRVNHDKLMYLISKEVTDKRLLKLIRAYLRAGIMDNGIKVKSLEGTPQGGPLSPLLSNIMLNELDKELERRGHKFCRYADDCNIYVKSKRAGKRVMESIKGFIEGDLKLKVNDSKSAVDSHTRRKFLGYSFFYTKSGIDFRVHKKSIEKLKDKIRKITNRNISMNFEYRVAKLLEITRGWVIYFKMAKMKKLMVQLDQWIRRRLRACIWKTWKSIKTRGINLVKLGLSKNKAWEFANTRKGYWRISNSPILSCTITNERLINRGFVCMASLYQKYAV